ncbi:MAG: hypothetical protein AB1657_03930 [Candidatus Micrarchaeota archaeon]
MIEVDEENFFIVTDIDRLMHLVATHRKVELGRLARELKMNPKEVEKWLHILEDEGLIKIEHSLTKIYAVWAGEAAPRPERRKEAPAEARAEKARPPLVVESKEEEEEKFRPFTTEELAPLEEEYMDFTPPAPEEPRRHGEEKPKKLLFKGKPKEEKKPAKEEPRAKRKEEAREAPRPAELKKSGFLELPPVEAESLRERLDEYLELIRKSKKELKDLEAEKERLYREGYLPLEKEFESSLESIQLAILEKEKRIMEAKEKVAGLPEQVEELEKLQQAVRQVEGKAHSILSRTKGQIEERAGTLQEAAEELGEQISRGEDEAMRERAKMFELKELLGSIQSNEEGIRNAIEENRRQMEEAKKKTEELEDALGEVVDARTLLAERIDTIQAGLDRKVRTLEELRHDLDEIEKVEGWFREYSRDYSKKISDLESYVAQNQQEISELMKAAELEYVKKYLEELSRAEEKYRDRLRGLELQDAGLEERIADAKARIRQLLAESTQLMEASRRKAASSSFDTSAARRSVEQKAAVIEEKAKERKGLFEVLTKGKEKKKK